MHGHDAQRRRFGIFLRLRTAHTQSNNAKGKYERRCTLHIEHNAMPCQRDCGIRPAAPRRRQQVATRTGEGARASAANISPRQASKENGTGTPCARSFAPVGLLHYAGTVLHTFTCMRSALRRCSSAFGAEDWILTGRGREATPCSNFKLCSMIGSFVPGQERFLSRGGAFLGFYDLVFKPRALYRGKK